MAGKKAKQLTLEEKLQNALVPKEEQPYKIPDNWCWAYWKYCGKFIAGNGFKNIYQGFTQYDIPYYKVGSLKFCDEGNYLIDETNTINEEIRTKLKAVKIPVNSIIFAKIGEAIKLNRRCLNKIECCIDNNLMAFISEKHFYKYIFYWTKSLNFYELTNATTVPALRKTDLENIPIPLPPINEQQRIVNKIEYLFTKLDKAKELIENTLAQFEQNKMAVLHKAFTGELTAKWRKENNIDLSSWQDYQLKDICEKITDGTHNSPINTDLGDYMYITAKNIKEEGIDLSKITYVSSDIHEKIYARCNVEFGDVLYIKDGATTGIATINTIKEQFSLLSSVAVLKPKKNKLLAKYLVYKLNSNEVRNMMINNMSGVAITRLTLTKIKQAKMKFPTIEEQQEIVNILDKLLAKYTKIQSLNKQLEQIELLKKSILAKAFRGELGTNDPQEESAEKLLAEILAEN